MLLIGGVLVFDLFSVSWVFFQSTCFHPFFFRLRLDTDDVEYCGVLLHKTTEGRLDILLLVAVSGELGFSNCFDVDL